MRQGQGPGEDLSQSQPSSRSHSEDFKMLEKWKRCHEGLAHPPWYHLPLKLFMNPRQVLIKQASPIDKPLFKHRDTEGGGEREDAALNHHELAVYIFKPMSRRSLDVHPRHNAPPRKIPLNLVKLGAYSIQIL